jgi:hypothetical protein
MTSVFLPSVFLSFLPSPPYYLPPSLLPFSFSFTHWAKYPPCVRFFIELWRLIERTSALQESPAWRTGEENRPKVGDGQCENKTASATESGHSIS